MKRPRIKHCEISSKDVHKRVLVLDQTNRVGVLERRKQIALREIKEDFQKLNSKKIEFSGGKIYIYSDIKDVPMGQPVLC